ncbi:MAG: division plane positioning ATPase MipZ [Pseudomonadota bacterium]
MHGIEATPQGAESQPTNTPQPGADTAPAAISHPAHFIVIGNEKGGSGKTTTAIHMTVALLRLGKVVGAIDLDSRQRSLSRYLENRDQWRDQHNPNLPTPLRRVIPRSNQGTLKQAQQEESEAFTRALEDMVGCNFIVIDSPGADTYLSRLAHGMADTIITPMNDSFVDFDLLAHIDPSTYEIRGPSLYSELVWESRKLKAMLEKTSIDWVVMRNRISSLDAKNKRRVGLMLNKLAARIGFRLAPGFGERVIFRELFPTGQTLFDLKDAHSPIKMAMSHVAARQEVRELLATLQLPDVDLQKLDI